MREYDSTGVDMKSGGAFGLLPDGFYNLAIIGTEERESSKGHYMVNVKAQVTEPQEFKGKWVYHNVTFLPATQKGAGMAVHFLKTIGQSWEGKFSIDPTAWVGCTFRARIISTKYQGKSRNEIKSVVSIIPEKKEDEIPF